MTEKERPTVSQNSSGFKFTVGSTSLLLVVLLVGTMLTVDYWASHQGTWVNPVEDALFFFVWLPMLLASCITGGVAVERNRGRTQGLIAFGIIAILVPLTLIQYQYGLNQ